MLPVVLHRCRARLLEPATRFLSRTCSPSHRQAHRLSITHGSVDVALIVVLLGAIGASGCTESPTQPTVASPTVTSLRVNPLASAILVGATFVPEARVQLSDGSVLDVTSDATWLSDAPQVAKITNGSSAVAVSRGYATLTAVYRGAVATAPVRVVDDWQGSWKSDNAVAKCFAGFFRACFLMPQASVVRLTLTQAGAALDGTVRFDYVKTNGTGGYSADGVVSGTLADDGSVVLAGNMLEPYSGTLDEPIVGWHVTVVDGDRRAGGFTIIYPLTPIEGQITRVEWTMAPMVRVAP